MRSYLLSIIDARSGILGAIMAVDSRADGIRKALRRMRRQRGVRCELRVAPTQECLRDHLIWSKG